jgi:hypothetical protein
MRKKRRMRKTGREKAKNKIERKGEEERKDRNDIRKEG